MTMKASEKRLGQAAAALGAMAALLVTAAAAAAAAPDDTDVSAAAQDEGGSRYWRVTASTGLDFSSGDFGTDTQTDVWYIPSSFKFEWDPIFVKVTVPYVVVDGDVVIVGDQPEGVPGLTGVRDGIGDVVLSAGFVYYPSSSFLPAIELTGKVKFATADEDKGLGTGEEDYTAQVELSKTFGWFTPFAGVGYKFIGDPPDFDFDNKLFASGGFSIDLGERVDVGVAYDWAQSAVKGNPDIHEISPFASIKLGRHFAMDPYALVGLSNASPDWGVGAQFRVFWGSH
jgi:hypothetical protein